METKLDGFRQLWVNLTSIQKTTLAFFAALVIVAVVGVALIASRPDYTVLFANLKPEDAAGIVQKLRDAKVQYRVTANGTAIEVPAKDVYEVRLQLAGQGLPQGGQIGYEIFDKNNLGVTDFQQKVDYIRALQGELQRTICSLENVTDSRVLIVIPDESLYSDEKKEASASVMLTLSGSGRPSDEQIASITNLVSASVEGLKPDRVTVTDTKGNLLADGSGLDSTGAKMSSTQLDAKRSVERSVQQSVETMLDRVVGPGKSVVRVNAKLSFDTRQTTNEIYEPGSGQGNAGAPGGIRGAVESEETIREDYGTLSGSGGGVPGSASNLAPNPGAAAVAQSGGKGYSRTQSSAKYSVTRRIEKVDQAPGKLEELSVAVMVDRDAEKGNLQAIRNAVVAAAGADLAKGDKVIVESVSFSKPASEAKASPMSAVAKYLSMGRNALAVILLIGFGLFLKGALSKQEITITGRPATSLELEPIFNQSLQGSPQGQVQAMAGAASLQQPLTIKKPSADTEIPLQSAQELAKEQPEEIAKVVRAWLSEDRRAA